MTIEICLHLLFLMLLLLLLLSRTLYRPDTDIISLWSCRLSDNGTRTQDLIEQPLQCPPPLVTDGVVPFAGSHRRQRRDEDGEILNRLGPRQDFRRVHPALLLLEQLNGQHARAGQPVERQQAHEVDLEVAEKVFFGQRLQNQPYQLSRRRYQFLGVRFAAVHQRPLQQEIRVSETPVHADQAQDSQRHPLRVFPGWHRAAELLQMPVGLYTGEEFAGVNVHKGRERGAHLVYQHQNVTAKTKC